MKVIVVGAGMAGLAAVHTLSKAGAEVICFESGAHAGGRVITERCNGFIFDPGAQFFFNQYATCFRLADELGIYGDRTSWLFRGAFPNKDGRFLPVVASINPAEAIPHLGETLRFLAGAGIPSKAVKDFLGILPMFIKRYKEFGLVDYESALDLDNESLADFVVRMGGKAILEHLFQSVSAALTLADPEKLSATYGMGLLKCMINGLNTFQHGLGTITERLAEKYADRIQLNSPVKRIVIEDGKVKGVEVNGGLVQADAVIPAITGTKLLKMAPGLPDNYVKALQKVTYSACCHVIFALPFKLFPDGWYGMLTPRFTKAMVSGLSDNSVKSKYYSPSGCSQISCWTYEQYAHELNDMSDEEIKRTLIKEVRNFLPAMPDEPLFTKIYRWREAVCIGHPGMLTDFTEIKRHHYRDVKGLYLAGEYLNMPSVESAAYSGVYAAKAALR